MTDYQIEYTFITMHYDIIIIIAIFNVYRY